MTGLKGMRFSMHGVEEMDSLRVSSAIAVGKRGLGKLFEGGKGLLDGVDVRRASSQTHQRKSSLLRRFLSSDAKQRRSKIELINNRSIAALVRDDPSWLATGAKQLQSITSTVAALSKSVARQQAAVLAVRLSIVERLLQR